MSLSFTSADKTYPFTRYITFSGYGQSYTIQPDNVLRFGDSNFISVRHGTQPFGSVVTTELAVGPDEYRIGAFFTAVTDVGRDLGANHPHHVYQSSPSSATGTVTAGTVWKAPMPFGYTTYSGVLTTGVSYYLFEVAPTAPAFFDYCRTAVLAGATEVDLVAQVKATSVSLTVYSGPIALSMVLPVIYDRSFL